MGDDNNNQEERGHKKKREKEGEIKTSADFSRPSLGKNSLENSSSSVEEFFGKLREYPQINHASDIRRRKSCKRNKICMDE